MAGPLPAVNQVAQPLIRQIDYRRIDYCARVKEIALVVAQTAIRVLFILASLLATAAAFPVSFHVIALPIIAMSSTTLAGFFFPDPTLVARPYFPPLPPLLRPAPPLPLPGQIPAVIPQEAPRGLINISQNCGFNSSVHFLESDPITARWLRNLLPANMDMPAFENFLAGYDPKPRLVADFRAFAAANPNPPRPVREVFREFVDRYVPPIADFSAYRKIQEAFQHLQALHEPFSNFFAAYDVALRDNQEVIGGNSQALRLALHGISTIPASEHVQVDAPEPLTYILDLLPDAQKMRIEEAYRYKTAGLPAIAGLPDARSRKEERTNFLTLEFKENEETPTTLDRMFNYYCDHDMEAADPIRYTGVDGQQHRYTPEHANRRFLEAPPALRFQIKRFYNVPPPKTWYSRIAPSWFPGQSWTMVKKDIPVEIPPDFQITLPNGERRRYQLVSFINHHGSSIASGHYTAARIVNGRKYFMSDRTVTQPDQAAWDERLRKAYVVCYLPIPEPAPVLPVQ